MLEDEQGYQTGCQLADEIRSTLAEHAIAADNPEHLSFRLFFQRQPDSQAVVDELLSDGYEIDAQIEEAFPGLWLCDLFIQLIPASEHMTQFAEALLQLAKKYEGEVDGWELVHSEAPDYQQIAHNILETVRSGYGEKHVLIQANCEDFVDLDMDFYQKTQHEFEHLGFVYLADMEDETISRSGEVRTFIRTMYREGCQTIGAFYYVPQLQAGIIDIETLMSDGTVLVSTTCDQKNSISESPRILSQYFASDLSPSSLYKAHLEHLDNVCKANPMLHSTPVTTFDELCQMQHLMQEYKGEHLKSIGWVTLEHLVNQSGGDKELALGVYEAIQDILKNE
ncbi:ribonuclease E inhibitor RraB [Aliiglaciecola sp. CAU 1673]|uniref:ribonuclease E inhibitor RraB n=1 Tax=Aliiglaciecola sp. CAU 1673 TaxID=3032595 RepID=UPI0023DA1A05|nr:ribonuclease E inhibitor RraB [Aliiglaciecola sp. CAU 1673]MDF2177625.1 ribonuclease E inhibitor RraB [Aliiglaciecola sp. CAU 1673]